MSTSNLATAIGLRFCPAFTVLRRLQYLHYVDSAFVDRADIVQYVDLPPREAIYEILRGCLVELVKKGIVAQVVRIRHRLKLAVCSRYQFKDVPGLAQAQLYERTVDFSNLSLTVQPIDGNIVSQAAKTAVLDSRERSRLLAIRLLKLAQKCRVGFYEH